MGECKNCHKCCTNILTVSDTEIKNIKKYIVTHNIAIHNPNSIFSDYVDECPFLDKKSEHGCTIYEVRPEICKYFECDRIGEYRPFHHEDKRIVNMLLTFDSKAFCPNPPNIKELNQVYNAKKKLAYGTTYGKD